MSASHHRAAISGRTVRLESERFHNATTAVVLLHHGRVLRIHSPGLSQTGQNRLSLTREGDGVEATIVGQPEPHVCGFNNQPISQMPVRAASE